MSATDESDDYILVNIVCQHKRDRSKQLSCHACCSKLHINCCRELTKNRSCCGTAQSTETTFKTSASVRAAIAINESRQTALSNISSVADAKPGGADWMPAQIIIFLLVLLAILVVAFSLWRKFTRCKRIMAHKSAVLHVQPKQLASEGIDCQFSNLSEFSSVSEVNFESDSALPMRENLSSSVNSRSICNY